MRDVDREVAHRAFVIFDECEHKEYINHIYRRSHLWLFRDCQRRHMKFKKYGIQVSVTSVVLWTSSSLVLSVVLYKTSSPVWSLLLKFQKTIFARFECSFLQVSQAAEPSNLYFENLEISPGSASKRKTFTCCVMFIVLIICCTLLIAAKLAGKNYTRNECSSKYTRNECVFSGAPAVSVVGTKPVWIVGSYPLPNGSNCLDVCDMRFYSGKLQSKRVKNKSTIETSEI